MGLKSLQTVDAVKLYNRLMWPIQRLPTYDNITPKAPRIDTQGKAILCYCIRGVTPLSTVGIDSLESDMPITNTQSGTNVHEIADGIFRINTPVEITGAGGFSFNQFLILDDEPLLFHTGPRKLFPLVQEAVASIMPVDRLRYVGFSHVEADECGSLNDWLRCAPRAVPLCGAIADALSDTSGA